MTNLRYFEKFDDQGMVVVDAEKYPEYVNKPPPFLYYPMEEGACGIWNGDNDDEFWNNWP